MSEWTPLALPVLHPFHEDVRKKKKIRNGDMEAVTEVGVSLSSKAARVGKHNTLKPLWTVPKSCFGSTCWRIVKNCSGGTGSETHVGKQLRAVPEVTCWKSVMDYFIGAGFEAYVERRSAVKSLRAAL